MRQLTEIEIDHLEQCIPELARHSCRVAHINALAAGHSVVESCGTDLLLTEPSGGQTIIGSVPPRTRVTMGVVLNVKTRSDSTASHRNL